MSTAPLPVVAGRPAPRSVLWEITGSCDLHCSHCLHPPEPARTGSAPAAVPEPADAACRRLLAELVALRPVAVGLIGGEPLLCDDWCYITKVLVAAGIKVGVVTNAVGWQPGTIDRLAGLGVGQVAVSLDADLPAVHDRRRGRDGAWQATVTNLRRLIAARASFAQILVITTVAADNRDRLPAMLTLLEREAPGAFWQVLTASPTPGGPAPLGRNEFEAVRRFLAGARASRWRLAGVVGGHEFGWLAADDPDAASWHGCPGGRTQWAIARDGATLPCLALPRRYADRRPDRSLSDKWQDDAAFGWWRDELRARVRGGCSTCRLADRCGGGCPEVAIARGREPGDAVFCRHRPSDR